MIRAPGLRILLAALAIALCGDGRAHPDLLAQIEQLSARLEETPADAALLLKRGDLYRRHEDYDAAALDFAAARAANPGHDLLDFYEGRLLHQAGDSHRARAMVTRYLETHMEKATAWKLLGDIHRALGEPDPAATAYERAIRFSQAASPDLYRSLVLARLGSGQDAWPDALAAVDQGLARFGVEVSLIGLGADIALALGRPRLAAEYLGRLPGHLPELPAWKTRAASGACLESSGTSVRAACLEGARRRLEERIDAFGFS